MKLLKYLFAIVLMTLMVSCDDPLDFDVLEATDFAPGILSAFPSGKTVKGDFDAKVIFVDGSVSPLSDAKISVMTDDGNELASTSKSLSGTRDSIEIDGAQFNSADMQPGETFVLEVEVTDNKGQTTSRSFPFEITALPFASNHGEMYIAGVFNGWGADEMTIVADNLWEIKEVDLEGGAFKLKNTVDWTDEDWGDSNCDGIFTSSKADGGNADTDCSYSGLVNIRFNDATLQYTVEPAITFEQNTSGLFLLGTFNNFQGSEFEFTQTADNFWELNEVLLAPGDEFKFAEKANFMGQNWGMSDEPGKLELFGANVVFGDEFQEAFYDLTFNDKTLEYTVTFNKFPSIGIIGSATPGGWDSDTDMTDNGDGTFSLLIELTDGEAKFRANDAWDTNWGGNDFPSGTGELNGPNIPVVAGNYRVSFTPETGEYVFAEIASVGIIGDATPGGWDADTDMMKNDDGTWSLEITLTDGAAKFRANDAWDVNWGAEDFPSGTGELNGPNIPVTAGTYLVTFDPGSGDYNFGSPITSVGLIGDATPGGWDADTDMIDNGDGTYQMIIGLGDGAVKFRANDAWDTNWGGTDFPSGTGALNGDNITVSAGIYYVTFDSNSGAYSFTPASIGIIGDATPGGWDSDTDMTPDASETGLLTITTTLTDGAVKFRAQDDWAINWGSTAFPSGVGTQNGDNIPVSAGTYTIKFNVNTGVYSFE